MMRKVLSLLLVVMFTLTANAKDIKTVRLTTTPQMHCAACEKKIKSNLRFEKGVKTIETNVDEQTVTVSYDTKKTTPEKIAKGFEKFGYKARQLKKGEKVAKNEDEDCPMGM